MPSRGFQHEAYLYAGTDEFVAGATTFLRPAVEAAQPALVMIDRHKGDRLRHALGAPDTVEFADIAEAGRNPAQIIPAWEQFAVAHADSEAVWGIGEPVSAGRSPAELVECRLHEALLNMAFADRLGFTLLCPYDTATLAPEVVAAAHTTHPLVGNGVGPHPSGSYAAVDGGALLSEGLPRPADVAVQLDFRGDDLADVRHLVGQIATAAGLGDGAMRDMVLAVDEVATNSHRHGGGGGRLLAWIDGHSLVFEVRDDGRVTDPLVGRRRPTLEQVGGRGLWIANQVCDLVQIRSSADGTIVRLHAGLRVPA